MAGFAATTSPTPYGFFDTDTDFKKHCSQVTNPYGDGNSIMKAVDLITSLNYGKFILKTEDSLAARTNI